MFAQKTTELLRRIRRYKSIGYSVLVVNHSSDTRYTARGSEVISHDLQGTPAISLNQLSEAGTLVSSGNYQVVAIDEGQFFSDLYPCIREWADTLPIHIVVAGLDADSDRNPFGDILRLIPHAEEVERLTAFCSVCKNGTLASMTAWRGGGRNKKEQVVVAGSDKYAPVCRTHWLEFQGAGADAGAGAGADAGAGAETSTT